MAAGYNSYHEAIRFSVPTISIPNMNTGMDDQLARVEVAEEAGAMIVLREVSKRRVQAVVERILDESVRNSMIKASEKLHRLTVQTKWQNGSLMRFDMIFHH